MKNLTFLSNLTRKINGDCTSSLVNVSRMSRLDSVSLVSRQSDLRKFASRIAAVLCLLLILGVGNVWGLTETLTLSSMGWSNASVQSSITATSATIALAKNSASTSPTYYTADGLRLYGVKNASTGCSIAFTAKTGITITGITFTHTSTNNGVLSASTGTYSDKVWSGSLTAGNTVTFKATNTGSVSSNPQVRITEIVITYTSSAASHTLSSAVSPAGTGSVTLGATTVAEGSTTTATATANTGYVFSSWAISGAGASLSSTTDNPTTVTMGTANATVTANFVAKTAASITLSIGGSTSSVSGYYVGDSYILPSTASSCTGKTFMGWSTVTIPTPGSKPTSNYYDKGASVTLTASQTFYAVYATASGGGSGSYTLDYDTDVASKTLGYGSAVDVTASDGSAWVVKAYKNSGMQINTGKNSSIKIPTCSGKITSIEITGSAAKAVGFSDSDYDGSGTITYVVSGTDATSQTLDFSAVNKTDGYIVPKSGSISITNIVVNYSSATYSNYTTSCVACSMPTLTFTNTTLTKHIGDANFTNTLTVTGNSLSSSVSYMTSNSTKATVNSSTGEVTLVQSTIEGTPVIITATRAPADDGSTCDDGVTQTYTLIIKNKIRWFSNEVEITSGSQTTETFYNGSITAIPSTPSAPSACSTKSFVGWTTVADWDSNEAPTPLYKNLSDFSSLKVRENMTFYAVFASTTTGDPESTLTQTLEYDTWNYSGTTTDKDDYRLFGNGAYIYSATFDLSKLSQVVVYGGTFGGDSYKNIEIKSASGTSWATESFTSTNQKKAYTITSSTSLSGTQALRIYSKSGNGTTNGVRISKVEIYEMIAATVGTGYITKCCTDWSNPTMTYSKNSMAVGDADATLTKSGTEHGTLTFNSSEPAIATVNSSGAVHAVSPGNVTITASWTKEGAFCAKEMTFNFTITGNCTVTFDANGGTGSMANQTGIPYNTATPLNTMSGLTAPAGQTFVGWNTAADGSGTAYADGANIKLTSNITLYAQWGTAYTITLNRNGAAESIVVLSTEFPYTLPTTEADYCDAWQFAGWSETSVADNSTSFTNITEWSTAENKTFYAVYKNAAGEVEAYKRISKVSELTSSADYLFVGYNSGTKYVMPGQNSSASGNITGDAIAEDGKDYYLKTTISDNKYVFNISGTTGAWTIRNKRYTSYYINTSETTWYTTTTSNNTYNITPNGLYWTVCNAKEGLSKPYFEFYFSGGTYPNFCPYTNTSAKLQIYKLGTTQLFKYTSTPSGGDCEVACDACGAEFTYPSMEKSTASADFTNTVIYTLKNNASTKTYSSSNTDVATITSVGVVHIVGKGKTIITMTQGRDNDTDPSHPVCGVTISYELTVIDPSLEVVEVTADDKIIVEHDFDGITNASVDSSKVDIQGTIADDIFISKYYEAASHMKLFALYNGTEHNIDLSQLRVRSGSASWGDHGVITLKNHPKICEDYPDFLLPPFTEIIFWSNNEDGDSNEQLCSCVSMNIDGKIYDYDDMKANKVPGWYRVETGTGITRFTFDGNDGLILERSTDDFSTWTVIDLLGAGTKSAPTSPKSTVNGEIQKADINDDEGFYWDTSSAADKVLSTNRFYLMRLSTVTSGLDAVEGNSSRFATLGTEWTGRGIGKGTQMEDYCASGELFSEVAQYDYAGYYTKYVEYADGWTATDNHDGTFTLQFETGKLAQLACKKIQVYVENSDGSKSAQVEYRVPIIVKNTTDITQSELFNKHDKDECKVCDVVIVNGGVLTKSKPTTPAAVAADRDQVYNVDVYGGGELYIPTGTTYNVNTLTIRSTGDAVGIVDVQGTLKRNNTTLLHSKRFHNVGSDYRWYYFSLPYDCNVSEVTFSNGDPAIHGVDFEIDWYDGEQRASTQANGNWKSIASHPDYPNVIKAGYGYTIAVEPKTGHDNVSLIFPMANFVEPTQVNVSVGNWGAEDDEVTVNHKGWNVVGNPFLTKYAAQEDLDINGELREGLLVCEGGGWTQTPNGVNYATVPVDGGASGYGQLELTNRDFNPFQSFIIQVGGDKELTNLAVQLKNAYKNKRSSIVRRKDSEYEAGEFTPVKLRVNLINANGEMDKTTLVISDKYTPEYDMTYDLTKWRGTSYQHYTRPVLASVYGGQELAFNALPDSLVAKSVPLTYYSRNAGTMAFELSSDYPWGAFEEVILYDKAKNIRHNLLTNGKYEFDAPAGEVGDRFYISAIVNRHKEPTIATSTDLIDMQNVQLTVCEHSILLNGLEEGTTVYVFDMLGRLIGRQTCSQPFAKFNVPAMGVYNIRLEGRQAGVTLRTIVK